MLFVLLAYGKVLAQNTIWINTQYHNIQFNPELTQFPSCVDKSGNSFHTAIDLFKVSYGQAYYGDVSLKKFSQSGIKQFEKMLSGKVTVTMLSTDRRGNIYLAGSFMDTLRIDPVSYILNTGAGFNLNYFILKLNSDGSFVWSKNISVLYGQFSVIQALNVIGNHLYAGILDFTSGGIRKFDLDGNEISNIVQNPVRIISSIIGDNYGNIIAGGSCEMGNVTFGNQTASAPFIYNVYFVKYNNTGVFQWVRMVEDITFQFVDLACDSRNNIYAAGDLFDSVWFGNIRADGRQWVYDFFLTKIDPSGIFQWVKEVPNHKGPPTGDARKGHLTSLTVSPDDEIFFSGIIRGTVNWGNNISTVSSGGMDALLLRYDTDGVILSAKKFGGASNDRIDCISSDSNSDLIMSGNFAQSAVFDTIPVSGTGYINSFIAKIANGGSQGTVNLSMIMQGFYVPSSDEMRMSDTVRLYLRQTVNPYAVVDSSVSVINRFDMYGSFTFANAQSGSYYLQVRHRNTLETWSALPLDYIRGAITNYDFTVSAGQAYGNNLVLADGSPLRYAMFGGDVNQDGIVDANDAGAADNDIYNVITGYVITDVTGDGFVDGSDGLLIDNNAFAFVTSVTP